MKIKKNLLYFVFILFSSYEKKWREREIKSRKLILYILYISVSVYFISPSPSPRPPSYVVDDVATPSVKAGVDSQFLDWGENAVSQSVSDRPFATVT